MRSLFVAGGRAEQAETQRASVVHGEANVHRRVHAGPPCVNLSVAGGRAE